MGTLNLPADWPHIGRFVSSILDELGKETGAVARWRHVKSGEALLRLTLAYAVEDLSLRSAAEWSTGAAMATIADPWGVPRTRRAAPPLPRATSSRRPPSRHRASAGFRKSGTSSNVLRMFLTRAWTRTEIRRAVG